MTRREQESSAGRFDSIEEVVAALRRGEMVVVADDERRENEGDLILPAERVTPEAVNFMITEGRGLLCVALEKDRLGRLGLSRMPQHGGGGPFRTAFMESVDAREGISTGISAPDRAHTIRLLADDRTSSHDIVSPGHLFPLEAAEWGVLRRAGHTEAAVDLARLAGYKPVGVICEILNRDGSMARLPELFDFAKQHHLRITTVAALAAYRRRTERLIALEEEINFPTDLGLFTLRMYRSVVDDKHHLALVMGRPAEREAPLARVHSECLTGDAFGSLRCDCGSQLREAMRMIAQSGDGVLLYLRQEGRGIGLEQKIRAYALQEDGLDTVEANEQLGFEADLRDYSVAAQMLADLGVRAVNLITNNPAKVSGLEDFGIRIAARTPLVQPATIYNAQYMETKRAKMGHLL